MKNNKKGFTLVELLAVIVILAVIILIAVTAVIPRMNKAKWKSFGDEALAFLKAADEKSVADDGGDGLCYVITTDLVESYVKKSDGTTYSGIVCRQDGNSDWKIYIKQTNKDKYVINGKTSCPTDYTSWTC